MINSLKSKMRLPMGLSKSKKRISLSQVIIVFLLSIAIATVAIPSYLTGKWSWADLPPVLEQKQLRQIRQSQLQFEGWNNLAQKEIPIGGNKWSLQLIEKKGQEPVTVMLMPQNYYKNHPNVEWVDIQGIQKWKTDSYKTLKFAASEGSLNQVKARFFRAWNKQTVAVVQWYAWPQGGNYASGRWFWADQVAQLNRQRVPWIAVCLKIPVEPLSDVKETEALAISLAQTVQNTLNREIFQK